MGRRGLGVGETSVVTGANTVGPASSGSLSVAPDDRCVLEDGVDEGRCIAEVCDVVVEEVSVEKVEDGNVVST